MGAKGEAKLKPTYTLGVFGEATATVLLKLYRADG